MSKISCLIFLAHSVLGNRAFHCISAFMIKTKIKTKMIMMIMIVSRET